MRNPLNKRILREFKSDLGKYAVIFLFLMLSIGFISGFLVAGYSMKTAYDNSFEKYNIEDGHFITKEEVKDEVIKLWEEKNIRVYKDYYYELDVDKNFDGKKDSTLRVFENRTEVNKVCLMEGELPENANEIAIDRMYADNNNLEIGDEINVGSNKMKISGLVALSDYSALFSDNKDTMFDSILFGVAILNSDGYENFNAEKKYFCYEYKFNEKESDEIELAKETQELMYFINTTTQIDSFIPEYANQAIHFTGDDIGKDRSIMIVLLYILIIIIAFVFAVTINHTIVKEAGTIGTLRASGYTKAEIVRHYLAMPLVVTLVASVLGNILGYSLFKNLVAAMYYGSYSLPTYETLWNAEAFVLTTVIPFVIMLIVNLFVLIRKLSLSPLKFIRRDFTTSKRKKAIKLPKWKFFNRFRIRVILQNISNYLTLIVGMIFANVLLLFGLMMSPILDNYREEIIDTIPCDYQYVLVAPVEVDNKGAEKYCVNSLVYEGSGRDEEVTVYGINDDSKYMDGIAPVNGVCISDGFAEKYSLKKGDIITLKYEYEEGDFEFEITDIVKYPVSLSVFLSRENFNEKFGNAENYFNGYYSDEELNIDEKLIGACITEIEMTKLSRQLEVSMGDMFMLIYVFAIALFIILVYLLTKIILEKNAVSISMVKILGYSNREISGLYIVSTTWVVVAAIFVSMIISSVIIEFLYKAMMKDMTGWLTFYIAPRVYIEMFVIGMIAYGFVAFLQYRKIKKIPMDQALKNVE